MNFRFVAAFGLGLVLAGLVCPAHATGAEPAKHGPAACPDRSDSASAATPAAESSQVLDIPFEKYVLPNGLEVILHEDHATPVVAVNLWYHVGSKEDPPGRTGLAHFFEHMMFQGSKHHNRNYALAIERVGGSPNATTTQDRTDYFETVPANDLELALWLESDRMGFLLPALSQARLDNQRDVVRNEAREWYAVPFGTCMEVIPAAFYPPDHPYSWTPLGLMADLDATTLDEAAAFFRRYYHPGNATLCIAGDFDVADTKRLVAKHLGPIPRGPKVERPQPRPAGLASERRIRMLDRAKYSQIVIQWETVPLFSSDQPTLDILGRILGDGQTSRLYRGLVRGRKIAQDASAVHIARQLAGTMDVFARPCDGCSLADVEAALHDEVQRLRTEPPSDEEVVQAINQWETGLIRNLARGGVLERADRLQHYNHYLGDPGHLAEDLERHRKVDPAAVQRVAQQYLGEKFLVVEMVPGAEPSVVPDPRKAAAAERERLAARRPRLPRVTMPDVPEDPSRQSLPGPGRESAFRFPPIHHAQLSNGMKVLVAENHQLPMVFVDIVFPAGAACDPADKLGAAYLTMQLWDKGTRLRSAERVADDLAQLGAKLSISNNREMTTVGLYCLRRNLGPSLDVVGDVVQAPAFPQAELDRERNIALSRLQRYRDNIYIVGCWAIDGFLYAWDHPYGRLSDGSPDSVRSITREDIEAFYRKWMRPEQATAIVVGDVTLCEAAAELERSIGDWRPSGCAAEIAVPDPPTRQPAGILLVDRPGASQSFVLVGLIGAERNSPDFYPLELMNAVLAGPFSSRLNMNLRESMGVTYGMSGGFRWLARKPGPYVAWTAVDPPATGRAIAEILREYEGMAGPRPASREELESARSDLVRRYPSRFETPSGVAEQLRTLVQFGLSDDEFNRYIPGIQGVTTTDVARVVQKYLDVAHLAVVVVGDRTKIHKDLRTLPIGKHLQIMELDDELRLVACKE